MDNVKDRKFKIEWDISEIERKLESYRRTVKGISKALEDGFYKRCGTFSKETEEGYIKELKILDKHIRRKENKLRWLKEELESLEEN